MLQISAVEKNRYIYFIFLHATSPQVLFALNQTLLQHEGVRAGSLQGAYTTEDLITHYNCGDLSSIIFNHDNSQVCTLDSFSPRFCGATLYLTMDTNRSCGSLLTWQGRVLNRKIKTIFHTALSKHWWLKLKFHKTTIRLGLSTFGETHPVDRLLIASIVSLKSKVAATIRMFWQISTFTVVIKVVFVWQNISKYFLKLEYKHCDAVSLFYFFLLTVIILLACAKLELELIFCVRLLF